MSSEAAYFPDALGSTAEVAQAAPCASEFPVELLKVAQPQSEMLRNRAEAAPRISEPSDEQLMAQVRGGEKEALTLLFRRHARAVRNVAYRILRNEAEADDLVQEVFFLLFRKAALYDPARGKATSWIIHAAYNCAFGRRKYLNTRHFYTCQELEEMSLSLADKRQEIPFHAQSMEGFLGKPLMSRFNARLSPEQRETIQLYFFEGYELKEIAELTGRPLANVRKHYYRGLEQMRKYVLPKKLRSK
jgi:RNA polymerase sigma-70 factor (ECF subfamily)